MQVDILAFGAHPDDVELSCSGTLLRHHALGKTSAVVDLTRGELGTRGTIKTREEEAQAASKILGISARENLNFRDGFFHNDESHRLEIIRMIRKYRPKIVIANAVNDRHPDHGRAAMLVAESFFLSGLMKIETSDADKKQEAWRPSALYHYIQDRYIRPDLIVDITPFMDVRMQSIVAYKTQFHDASSKEPQTYLSTPYFLDSIRARAMEFGRVIGVTYAEGFTAARTPGTENLLSLI